MDVLKHYILQRNGGINLEVLQTLTCFNILCHAASAIICDFIFAKMRVTTIISCPFLAKLRCMLR